MSNGMINNSETDRPRPSDARGRLIRTDDALTRRLAALARRLRMCVLIEGVAWVVVFLFAACSVQLAIDYATRPDWSMRAVLSALILVGTGRAIWRRLIRPMRVGVDVADAAHLVERRFPELASLLVSAVRFGQGDVGSPRSNSPGLMATVAQRAARASESVDFASIVDTTRARRAGAAIVGVSLFIVVMCTVQTDVMAMWFSRNVLLTDAEWWQRTHLIVEVEGRVINGAEGDDIEIRAHAVGVIPRVVEIAFETEASRRGRETMIGVGRDGFRHTFKKMRENLRFHLEGGDDRTVEYEIKLSQRPRVIETEMRIESPEYTRIEPITLGDGQRAVRVLPGSNVTISVGTSHPAATADLMVGRELVAPAVREGDRYVVALSPTETHTYHFALIDEVGLANKQPVRFSIRVVKDEPPRARMTIRGVGDMVTPEAVLPIAVEFSDKYGLATAELLYDLSRQGGGTRSIPLPSFTPSAKTFATSVLWPVASESPIPGDRITLFAHATDFDDVSGPNFAQSPEVVLRVVTRDDLLAELSRREQEYRMEFERLVSGQEKLRGGLLSVFAGLESRGASERTAADLAPLERRQRTIAGSVNVIRQRFEHILAELRVNQLDTAATKERLGRGVIEPMSQLAKRDLVAAADALRRFSRDADAETARLIDAQQAEILTRMRAILASMLQWEGYQEVVTMLRDIVKLQEEMREETKDRLLEEGGDVFDD